VQSVSPHAWFEPIGLAPHVTYHRCLIRRKSRT
jgi:hypothetical protein